jgi:PAS domain S-box-containing protein
MQPESLLNKETIPEFLSGGGEMGERIREFNWENTPLGPPSQWPQSLKTCIRIMLTSRQPIWIGWGKELIKFYNDPYKEIVGGKHPWALGAPASVVWKEIWQNIEPMLRQVMDKNEGTYVESQLLIMERNGYPEETYYTFSYTPIPGDMGGTAGMFCANTDDTEKIISERQLKTLTGLGKGLNDCNTFTEVIRTTIDTLHHQNPRDFPVVVFRKIENQRAILVYSSPLENAEKSVLKEIDLTGNSEVGQTINKAIQTKKYQVIDRVEENYGRLPSGAWDIPPTRVIILPIAQVGKDPYGVLVIGVNPFRLLDEKLLGFFNLIADQVATSLTQVHVLEEERERAAALAELDKAKTIFFTNISHEFRTPLTLMLGSLEEMLNKPAGNEEDRTRIETTHRNAMRLLRLVNNLLDFSRIEAGRIKAQYQLTDITKFTVDLASNFRAVAEAAGLQFQVSTQPVSQSVYVDREMWEKIVLNLLSNAFKYTLTGGITLLLSQRDKKFILEVTDTGVGIPESDLPKMFERFHRVQSITGRTFEGTGIGLSLVKELVELHGGKISVRSKLGEGSTFQIIIPTGKDHLPGEHIIDKTVDLSMELSDAFIEEAASLINQRDEEETIAQPKKASTVLVVDDNVDMRSYMKGLLEKQFNVIAANNGMDALQKLETVTPDLIVSDIMMPIMDGIQLLKSVKENPRTASLPVILVSARAGEEAKIEGFEIGADDYLIKPFSAKELIARIKAQIMLARKRRAIDSQVHDLFVQAPTAIQILRGPEFIYELANDRSLKILGRTREEVLGKKVKDVFPEAGEQGVLDLLREVYSSGERYTALEVPLYFQKHGQKTLSYLNVIYQPVRDDNDQTIGIMVTGDDVTSQVLARKSIEESERRFRTLAESLPQLVWIRDVDGNMEYTSKDWEAYSGISDPKIAWREMTHPEDWEMIMHDWEISQVEGRSLRNEVRLKNKNGEYRWHYAVAEPLRNEAGEIVKWIGAMTDVHVQKTFAEKLEKEVAERTRELQRKNQELANSESFLQQLIDSSVEFICVLDKDLNCLTVNRKFETTLHVPKEVLVGKNLLAVNPGIKETEQLKNIQRALQGETIYIPKTVSTALPTLFLDSYIVPLRIEGRIDGVIIMARDVTDIVATEKLLEQKNNELLRSNEDLQQFAHVASHDLKEPVRKIRTFANRLMREFGSTLPANAKLYVGKMEKAAERMYTMIDGVLQYSSLASFEQPFQKTDLNEVIRDIETDLEIMIAEKDATIEHHGLPVIEGSSILLYQLFYNLINNSLKFSQDVVEPFIKITADTIYLDAIGKQNEWTKIMIRDNGIGFDIDDARKIFKPFSRLNSKDKYEGTGLGLALCKKIVERHNGTIEASSKEGEGSLFVITLPKKTMVE